MTVNNELDINTLNWVKSEIDETMKQARTSLESYVEDQSDDSQILFCINYLHQVNGTLQMVELYGASLLAEELEQLANAIYANKVKNKEEAFEVLMRGSIQLPDYLEKLQAGQKDTPIVLLPLFNDMRAARSEALLSETSLFNPNLDINAPAVELSASTDIAEPIADLAKQLRHRFHLGLLGWFKGKDEEKSLAAISNVLQALRSASEDPNTNKMLWIADGLIDSLKAKGIEASIAIKSLIGQVDRNIKKIIDGGEVVLAMEPPNDLLKNLLYYVASSSADSDKTKSVKETFKLTDVMPDARTLEKARADLNAPNLELMDTVSGVLREDLQQVKDSLDIFMRSDDKNIDILVPVSEKLTSMADTLGMLSMGPQRKELVTKVDVINGLIDGSHQVEDKDLMEIASTIIEIEHVLDAMSETTAQLADAEPSDSSEPAASRKQPKSAEQRKLLESVVTEAKVDISVVKEAVSEFSRQLNHPEVLNDVPALLDKVRGSLNILQLDRAANLMLECKKYIEENIIPSKTIPEPETLDYLADAISSIEYYMESLVDSWGEPTAILNVAATSLEELGKILEADRPTVRDPGASQDAIQIDHDALNQTMLEMESDDTIVNLATPDEHTTLDTSLEQTITDLEQPTFDEPETVNEITQPELPQEFDAIDDTLKDIEKSVVNEHEQLIDESPLVTDLELSLPDEQIVIPEATLELDSDAEEGSFGREIERLDEALGLWFMDPVSSDVASLVIEVIKSIDESIDSGNFTGEDKENAVRITSDMKQTIQRIGSDEETFSADTEKVMQWARDSLVKYFDEGEYDGEIAPDAVVSEDNTETDPLTDLDSASLAEELPEVTASAPIEIDEEIFSIFLEEAEEEFENISNHLPLWKADTGNLESLKEIRRSFHTLKGSGRLVGANDLGEFAWSFENMLNHVIDKTINTTPELLDLTERGRLALPKLYDLLKAGARPNQQIFSLMEHADSLSRGESFTPLTETISSVSIPQPDLSSLDAISSAGLQKNKVDESVDKIQRPEIDSVLLEIYRKEVATHLLALREYINDWHKYDKHDVTEPLFRALHTLTGSARTTGVLVVSDLCTQLELYIKLLQAEGMLVSSDGINIFEDAADRIELICVQLGEQVDELYSTRDLVERIVVLMDSLKSLAPSTINDSGEASQSAADITSNKADVDDYDDELLEIFIEEGTEILDESDQTLHAWIGEPENSEYVQALQRQLHTLKGGARMSGVTAIGDLSHRVESLITDIVDGTLNADNTVFKVLQESQDSLVDMLEHLKNHQSLSNPQTIIDKIDALSARSYVEGDQLDAERPDEEQAGEQVSIESLTIEEEQDTEVKLDLDTEVLAEDDSVVKEQAQDDETVLIESDELVVDNQNIEELANNELSVDLESTPEQLNETSPGNDLSIKLTEELTTIAEELESSTIEETGQQSADDEVEEDTPPSIFEPEDDSQLKTMPAEQVRVRADTLDNLVNFAGEVSIYRSRLEQQVNSFRFNLQELDETVERFRGQLRTFEIETEAQIQTRKEETLSSEHEHFDPLEFDRFTQMQQISRSMLESMNDIDSLRNILSSLNRESETLLVQQSRVNTELQEGLMGTRLVPFDKQVTRLKRIVRQTSSEIGNQVSIEFEGVELELDRAIVERMMPPIEHMIRNAIAHGIEMPEERKATGKKEQGSLVFSMKREGADVVFQIKDDGAGIDFDAIKNKAIESGLINKDADVPEKFLIDMILESGFSTADEVTQIAGRGVGMDVVNNEIKQLGGVLNIDTAKGKGTIFTVSMPLSLAVTRALMIYVGDSMYAVPLLSVEGVERVSHETLIELQASEHSTYKWIDEDFHYVHLGHLMDGIEPSLPGAGNKSALLMVRSGDFKAALHIEGLVGSREIVMKPVGPQISSLRGISGATIMGDGRVVLILDPGVLIRLALAESEAGYHEIEPELKETEQTVDENKLPTVMVVDDSITVRKVTSRFLERNELEVIQAKDGVDALTQLLDVIPDVMLLDVEMPRMDGFELAINMRNDERLKNIPIIMITSRTGQKHRDRAMNIGVNMYMGKPYNEVELLENIHLLLNTEQ